MSCACGKNHPPEAGHGRPAPSRGQIALSGKIICTNADQLKIVLEYLPEHIALSREEPGCLYFDITQTDDPLIWQVEELYTDETALKAHKNRLATSTWASKSTAIKRDIHRIDG